MAGKLYALNVVGFPKLDGPVRKQVVSMKGQAKVIFDELKRDKTPRLIADIAAAVDGKFPTVQTTLKVVTFYIVKWRAEGIVLASAADVADESVDEAFEEILAELNDEAELERAESAEE